MVVSMMTDGALLQPSQRWHQPRETHGACASSRISSRGANATILLVVALLLLRPTLAFQSLTVPSTATRGTWQTKQPFHTIAMDVRYSTTKSQLHMQQPRRDSQHESDDNLVSSVLDALRISKTIPSLTAAVMIFGATLMNPMLSAGAVDNSITPASAVTTAVQQPSQESLLTAPSAPSVSSKHSVQEQDTVIEEVWNLINRYYIDSSFNHQDWDAMKQKALDEGRRYYFADDARNMKILATMVNSLGDRYTRLLEKDQYASIQKFDLIGVGVTLMPNAQKEIMVGAPPIEGSAADRAGLHVGDFVTAVNGRPTKGRNAFDIIDQIAEESNAKTVTFTILRKEGPPSLQRVGDDSAGQTFDVTMERQTMKVKDPVQFKLTERRQDGTNVGYIRISEFNSLVNSSLQQALKELKKQGANAYVLDLRANTGGAFQSAVEISGMFLKDKVATYVVDRNNVELPFRTPKMQDLEIDPKVPMVIWLDGMSASASEVLAGSLHDNCRAVTMGDNSFGKGLIQAVYGLQNGAGLVVTVAQYITPSGTEIQGKGIVPDISGYMPAPVFIPVLSSDTSKVDFKDISQRLDPNMCHIPPDRAPSKPASESIVNSA